MGAKKIDQAIGVFRKNVELYPESANVYDSLGEALEVAGKYDSAAQSFQKAIEQGWMAFDRGELTATEVHGRPAQPAQRFRKVGPDSAGRR